MPQARIKIAKPDIIRLFQELPQRVFRHTELSQILSENREFWRLAQNETVNSFISFLIARTKLKGAIFKFPNRTESRYTWGDVPFYELLMSIRPNAYFSVDISCHEYCRPKKEYDLDGYTIYVYTPEMIVCEKLRAICQQMPEYAKIVTSPSRSARARDFFDICTLVEHFALDLTSGSNQDLLRRMFEAKRVPLDLLHNMSDHREYHRSDFAAVEATVKPGIRLREFDYYFDYVVTLVRALKPFGDK